MPAKPFLSLVTRIAAGKTAALIVDESAIIDDRLVGIIEEINSPIKTFVSHNHTHAQILLKAIKIDILLLNVSSPVRGVLDILRFIKDSQLEIGLIIALVEESLITKKETFTLLGCHYVLNRYNEFENIATLVADFFNRMVKQ